MTVTNQTRCNIMLLAWELFREGGRTFSNALRGSWALTKRLDQAADTMMRKAGRAGGRLHLSPMMFRSTVRRATATQVHAAYADRQCAALAARLGR